MSTPSTSTDPAVGISTPSNIDSVVVLPAPLPPSKATVDPGRHREVDLVDREHRLEPFGQACD